MELLKLLDYNRCSVTLGWISKCGSSVMLRPPSVSPRGVALAGFGTWQIPSEDTAEVVRVALEAGYRHIDTAQMYRNEHGVGKAVRSSGLSRDEVFLTSKLSNAWHRPDDARHSATG